MKSSATEKKNGKESDKTETKLANRIFNKNFKNVNMPVGSKFICLFYLILSMVFLLNLCDAAI